MKLFVTVILTMAGLAAGEVDEELNTKYLTMSRSNFLIHFNEQNYSWKKKQYSNFYFHINSDYISYDYEMPSLPYHYIDPNEVRLVPESFDSRVRWPHCDSISEIYNQKACNSCWTHGVANTASDRTCIHTGIPVKLSEQDLECSHPKHTICGGGDSLLGFYYWEKQGLVTRGCKPYRPENLNRQVCERRCQDPHQNYYQDKHFAQKTYRIYKDDYQIKAELLLNGPIQAVMEVYEDFIDENRHGYSSGIYVHTHGNWTGKHSVRIIGYGVENGVDYWLVANSWSKVWGENGLFRIKRFQKLMNFEDRLCTGLPKTL